MRLHNFGWRGRLTWKKEQAVLPAPKFFSVVGSLLQLSLLMDSRI